MNIRVLKDPDFTPVPEYTADDVAATLERHGTAFDFVNHEQLSSLSRPDCDCLILPYLTGNFSESAFANLLLLHEHGASLFMLGDQPHIDKWYPICNMRSFEMHLTRYQEPVRLLGLTEKGKEIIGELEDFDQFRGHDIVALRITGFPEDITHSLLDNCKDEWHFTSVVLIERKGDRFMAGKVAQIGFTGGEPREVALGVYPLPWTYDIGPLNHDWKGLDKMVLGMLQWCQPSVSGAVQLLPVHREDESAEVKLILRNPTTEAHTVTNVTLKQDNDIVLFEEPSIQLAPGERKEYSIERESRPAGITSYKLEADLDSTSTLLHETFEHVIPSNVSANPIAFGVSSHLGYREPYQSEEVKHFQRHLKARGCQYIRLNVPWEKVEPEPGRYEWGLTDDMVAFAEKEGLTIAFWMFPTVRGSALGDAGIPEWTLKEPAIDRDGNKGNFPCIWSPFYREHYFNMVKEFCKRYANTGVLNKFIFDFGNSDFSYGYYYYVSDKTLFDYSPHEQKAFARYLQDTRHFSLADVSRLYGREFKSFEDVPVPYVEEKEPWSIYLDFRPWSISNGMLEVQKIIQEYAPEKLPEDLPGHGLGSIADMGAASCDVTRHHWYEQQKFQKYLTDSKSSGPVWGGEAWQVGGSYKEFDNALFNAVRYNPTYHTIPGPDINVFGEELARIAYIKRSTSGAERRHSQIACWGKAAWNDWSAITQIMTRIDQGGDYLRSSHRFDFSCYKLLFLPTKDMLGDTSKKRGGLMYLPSDEPYYWLLRESVEKGSNLVVFPESCVVGRDKIQRTFLRQVCDLMDVRYGDRIERTVSFTDCLCGGQLKGQCRDVVTEKDDKVLAVDENQRPVCVQRSFGEGSYILVGWDDEEDGIDDFNYMNNYDLKTHTVIRFADYLGLECRDVKSGQACLYKDKLTYNDLEFFLAYSHQIETRNETVSVSLNTPADRAIDLATGDAFALEHTGDGWHTFNIEIHERKGRYLQFGI